MRFGRLTRAIRTAMAEATDLDVETFDRLWCSRIFVYVAVLLSP